MITVRFPSGVALTYNELTHVTHGDNTEYILSTKSPNEGGKKKVFIQASAGVLVEFDAPCVVTAAPLHSGDIVLDALLTQIASGGIQHAPIRKIKDLKRALAKFNARSGCWGREPLT